MSETVLSVDLGTSALKAALIDGEGRVLAHTRQAYPTHTPHPGWSEQNPQDWLAAYARALDELRTHAGFSRIAACVTTGQMSAALLVDDDNTPLTPCLIWSDQRAAKEAERTEAALGKERHLKLTGNPSSATYTGPKLAWLFARDKGLAHKASAFLQPKDWLAAQLTGQRASDPSDASCTGLFDLANGVWSEELLALYRIDTRLAPAVQSSSSILGTTTENAAKRLGLPSGLPVVIGGGDGPMTAVGTGSLAPGTAYASLGTSAWVSFSNRLEDFSPDERFAAYAHVVPSLVVETGAMQAAGAALEWVAALFDTRPRDIVEHALAQGLPRANAPLFLPYLQGERTPYWFTYPGGTFIGLSRAHTKADVANAVLEGVLFQLRLILKTFAERGRSTSTLRIAGGFSEDRAFFNRLATSLGIAVQGLRQAEHATSLGAAMLAFEALGHLPSLNEAHKWARTHSQVRPDHDRQTLVASRFDLFERSWRAMDAPTRALANLTAETERTNGTH